MEEEDKLVKQIIVGKAVPKSLSLIELEKNYSVLAEIVVDLLERVKSLEEDVERLMRKLAHLEKKSK